MKIISKSSLLRFGIIGALTCAWTSVVQATEPETESTTKLTVSIKDIKEEKEGVIIIMVFDQANGFPIDTKKAAVQKKIPLSSPTASHTFEDIKPGNYAVCVFIDRNDNGKIDTKLKMPEEPVGASNLTKMRRPSFEKCSFEVPQEGKTVEIRFVNQ